MKIYTRTGDRGETGIPGGHRVRKDDPRTETCGALDELNCFLGLARAESPPPPIDALLEQIQHQLFRLGAQLASPGHAAKEPPAVEQQHVDRLEAAIDAAQEELRPLAEFILPGGTRLAALLHVARAVCRRAERRVVALAHGESSVGTLPISYLNRLGDLLFVLARLANARSGTADVLWRK